MKGKNLKTKAEEAYRRLKHRHPDATIALKFSNPVELLVATILSAQCTDVKVNQVTAKLFTKYRTPADFLAAPAGELENDIHATGFFRQKTKSIRGAMQAIAERHGGQVPADLEALTKLPGVGRKTANVLLGNAFGIPGLVVDTHVSRVSQRIGLTKNFDPVKIEFDLMELIPQEEWTQFSHVMIFHGRRICVARKPKCEECPVNDLCDFIKPSS